MRLTNVLLKGESHRWKFRMLWHQKVIYKETRLSPSFIHQRGIEVPDATEVVKEPLRFPRWECPIEGTHFAPPKTIKDDPNYHEEPIYEFDPQCRLLEGETQACILTKSQPFYELPPAVEDLENLPMLPDQDLLVQRILMQANVWDPSKEKLKKRIEPSLPIWNFKAEFGIPPKRRISIVIKNLVRLCEMLGGWYPSLSAERRSVFDSHLSTFFFCEGNKHVSIRGSHNLMVYSRNPLPPFASEDVIDESTRHELPDLSPIAPTLDLRKQHVWKLENITGVSESFSHQHPHTLFIGYDNTWNESQRNATALMFCFGHALALAKRLHGWETRVLPEPISTQCIMTNGDIFRFVCFQLNTLDFTSPGGVKNLVWFDEDERPMFNRIVPKRAMLRNTRYEDYDPRVFRQIVAFYTNGLGLRAAEVLRPTARTPAPAAVQQ